MENVSTAKKKKGLGALQWVIIAVCVCVFAFCGWKIYGINANYKQNEETYNEIADFVLTDVSVSYTEGMTEEDDVWPMPVEVKQTVIIPRVDFAALLKINKNAVAWLYSPGTVINYPVARGTNNSFYINHAFNGKYDEFGSLFMDYRNAKDFSSRNTVIYGHHLKNGNMFASLENYHKQKYYDEHPVIYMTTANGKYRLEIFAGYVTPSTSEAYRLTFSNDASFQKWLDNAVKSSNFKTDVKVTASDRVVTLSTCVYNYTNARYVVHCKVVECEDGIWY